MTTRTISVRVSEEAARVYESASESERRKLETLVGIQLARRATSARPLEEVMRDMSCKAQGRGLTPEILAEILDGDD